MKLYDVPAGARIKVIGSDEEVYKFYNLDGMFSYCTNKEGKVVHLEAWTDVEIVKDK